MPPVLQSGIQSAIQGKWVFTRRIEGCAKPQAPGVSQAARLEQDYPRGGYFVAHELGHCLLHTDQLVRLAQMPAAQQAAFHRGGQVVAHAVYRDTEWQANAFASAILMPARGLLVLEQRHSGLRPTDVAQHFHVSVEAASYRLELYNKRKRQLI